MKRIEIFLLVCICLIMPGCSSEKKNQPSQLIQNDQDTKILVVYFTRLKNTTTTDIDEIISGGGPYGNIDKNDADALSSASIQIKENEFSGNTETVAQIINHYVKGRLFSIETKEKYPVDYDTLINQGSEENSRDVRPQLATKVENMNEYNIVFIGFPDWYYDVPMAVKSFIEEYDFSNKTIIPFCTSAGSGFAGSLDTLQSLLPNNTSVLKGLAIDMTNVKDCDNEVIVWLKKLGFKQ